MKLVIALLAAFGVATAYAADEKKAPKPEMKLAKKKDHSKDKKKAEKKKAEVKK